MLAISRTGIENLSTVSSEKRDVYVYADDALCDHSGELNKSRRLQSRKAKRELTIGLIIKGIRGDGIRTPHAEIAIYLLQRVKFHTKLVSPVLSRHCRNEINTSSNSRPARYSSLVSTTESPPRGSTVRPD